MFKHKPVFYLKCHHIVYDEYDVLLAMCIFVIIVAKYLMSSLGSQRRCIKAISLEGRYLPGSDNDLVS
jgi:hypothetical protein